MIHKNHLSLLRATNLGRELSALMEVIPSVQKYPPIDVYQEGESYKFVFAVAGFQKEDLEISLDPRSRLLVVEGKNSNKDKEEDLDKREYYIKNIAHRSFITKLPIPEFAEISKPVTLKDGILTIEIKAKTPEEMKTKKVEIE